MISVEQAVGQILAADTPVLCLDTCSMLDLIRAPARDTGVSSIEAAVFLLKKAEANPKEVTIVIMQQVSDEVHRHMEHIKVEVNRALEKIDLSNERVAALHQVVGIAPPAVERFATLDYAGSAENIIGRLNNAAIIIDDQRFDQVAHRRMRNALRPASQGKNSFADCIIFTAFVELAKRSRAEGFEKDLILLTSNTTDFADHTKRAVHPEILAELEAGEVSLGYLETRYKLFPA